jgi:hypothetical protein
MVDAAAPIFLRCQVRTSRYYDCIGRVITSSAGNLKRHIITRCFMVRVRVPMRFLTMFSSRYNHNMPNHLRQRLQTFLLISLVLCLCTIALTCRSELEVLTALRVWFWALLLTPVFFVALPILWQRLLCFIERFRTKPLRTFQKGAGYTGEVTGWDGHTLEITWGNEIKRYTMRNVDENGEMFTIRPMEE